MMTLGEGLSWSPRETCDRPLRHRLRSSDIRTHLGSIIWRVTSRSSLPPAVGASSGDDPEQPFRVLFERYYGQVNRFFRRKGMDAEDARDLAQEVFLNVYKGLAGLRQDAHFQSWLYTISANVYKNALERLGAKKRAAVHVPLEVSENDSPGDRGTRSQTLSAVDPRPRPMEALLEKEKLERLRQALTELPEQMQRCVRLRVAEDLPYQVIADALGISINTVKAHLRQARMALREKLTPYFAEVDVGLPEDEG
jgi:RNA polymerase sigma-70 factor (ECF subfamily)